MFSLPITYFSGFFLRRRVGCCGVLLLIYFHDRGVGFISAGGLATCKPALETSVSMRKDEFPASELLLLFV